MAELIGENTASIEQQRDNWIESARQHAVNSAYQEQQRMILLRWIRDTAEIYPELKVLVPQSIKDDYMLLDLR